MLTSTHWPQGAQFLHDLHTAMTFVANRAPASKRGNPFATVVANPKIPDNGHARLFLDVTLPLPPGGSAHERLPVQHVINHARAHARTLLSQAASLPGLAAHGRIPRFSITALGAPTEEPVVFHGLVMLAGATVEDPQNGYRSRTRAGAMFGPQTPNTFHQAAQRLLDAIDVLCTYAPDPQAPVWTVLRANAAHGHHPTVEAPAFRANCEEDARAILPALTWRWNEDLSDCVFFQAPPSTAARITNRPLILSV